MAVLLANVRSYLPKKEAIEFLLDDKDTDIAILTESWLTPDIQDQELLQSNSAYTIHRLDRVRWRRGGVAILIRKNIPSYLLSSTRNHEIVYAVVPLPSSTNIIIDYLRAPDIDNSFTSTVVAS